MRLLLGLLFLAFLGSWASGSTLKTTKKPSPLKPLFSDYDLSLSYGIELDPLDENEKKIYEHSFSLGLSTEQEGRASYQLGAEISFIYLTLNSEIENRPRSSDFRDAIFDATYRYRLTRDWSWNFDLNSSFPLSEAAKLEGYKNISSMGTGFSFKPVSWYSVSPSLRLSYLFNTYEYSTSSSADRGIISVSAKEASAINPDYWTVLGLSQNLYFLKQSSLRFNLASKYTHHLDGSWLQGYNSSLSVATQLAGIGLTASYTWGGFYDPRASQFWFIDQQVNVLSLGLSYVF